MSESSGANGRSDEEPGGPKELLVNIQRLTRIVLDELEQGSKKGTLNQAEIRLLGSIGMRSLGLWQEILSPTPRRSPRKPEEAFVQLAKKSSILGREDVTKEEKS